MDRQTNGHMTIAYSTLAQHCKIFNLCGPDPLTSQTDGQKDRRTDDMRSQDRALQYSASCGKLN